MGQPAFELIRAVWPNIGQWLKRKETGHCVTGLTVKSAVQAVLCLGGFPVSCVVRVLIDSCLDARILVSTILSHSRRTADRSE